jgi:hypothetical protein
VSLGASAIIGIIAVIINAGSAILSLFILNKINYDHLT